MFEFIVNPATAAVELQYVSDSTVAETPIEETTPVVDSPTLPVSLFEAVLSNNHQLVKYDHLLHIVMRSLAHSGNGCESTGKSTVLVSMARLHCILRAARRLSLCP